jgi:hypothetical protein
VSPGLKLLPSWNTVRLEPCRAFRREATCAPAKARPREQPLPGALSCPVAFRAGQREPGIAQGSYVVTLRVTGDGFNGTGPMNFELRDGQIARLRIS